MFRRPTQLLIQGQWWSNRATHLSQVATAIAVSLVVVVMQEQAQDSAQSSSMVALLHRVYAAETQDAARRLHAPAASATVVSSCRAAVTTSGAVHWA